MNMSAKLIYSLTDENPDLQKQIGCMNGFFRLFDRHRYLASHTPKRLPQSGKNGDQAIEANNRLKKATEKNSKKVVQEKRRTSMELSRHSFSSSSSCSSSFSSLDYNRTAHLEPSPSSQTISSETLSRDLPINHPNGPTQFSRKSVDLRDVVKDSMHREARGLSVKTAAKEQAVVRTLKYIDSPRPSEPPNSAKPRISGVNDSFRVFSKFREGHLNSNEDKNCRTRWAPKDPRRLSYDGRESQDILKSTIKLKELPRLSLDSRQGCIRGSAYEVKSSYLLNDMQMQPEPGSSKRASSVVAKLMGLVDPTPIADDSTKLHNSLEAEKQDPLSRSSRTTKVNKQLDHFSGSPRNSRMELASPQMKNADLVIKTTPNQKFPIETAPWKQPHGHKAPQSPSFKSHETPAKTPTKALTVYGEIEKRLADLEFKKSGKDLRALKQILEAMQKTEEDLENKKDQKFAYQSDGNSSLDHGSNLGHQRNLHSNISDPPTSNGVKTPKGYKSPIVIMKPAKLIGKNTDSASTMNKIDNLLDLHKNHSSAADNRKVSLEKRMTKHLTPRNTQVTNSFHRRPSSEEGNSNIRTARFTQPSKMPQSDSDEKSGNSGRNSRTISPRLQQRRSGLEKQSTPTSPSDSSRSRRHGSRQQSESSSPGRKCRPRSSNMQQITDHLSDTRTRFRDLCHQGNSISLQSESNISSASDIENEVSSSIKPDQMNSLNTDQNRQKQKNPTAGFCVNRKMAEPGRATPEQPSPVSVLDATFYRDDSLSPVKKTSNAFKDDETPYPDEVEWALMDLDQPSNGRKSNPSTEVDQKVLENLKHWLQNPQELNCADVEQIIANNEILCDSKNPDHKYISDILLASNILRKLESGWMNIQCHKSDHLINPKLFFALEQSKASTQFLYDEHGSEKNSDTKMHRKLLFDVVDEILVRKLVVTDSFTQWVSPDKQAGKEGQQLLKELCSEVDRLQGKNSSSSLDEEDSLKSIICEDMMHWPMNWTEYDREIPAVVLDVERLIFKDLITEVVSSEAAILQGRPGGHCRQLFPM
ncbi:protein LONGIFOLIA 1 [Morus notabilis]|nr:protein LONGIFOLIA 1 [Morus notabilis]